MTFGYHFKGRQVLQPRLSQARPAEKSLEAKPKIAFTPPKTGSESGFIREIPIARLKAGKAAAIRPRSYSDYKVLGR